jgi:hypothetical protein
MPGEPRCTRIAQWASNHDLCRASLITVSRQPTNTSRLPGNGHDCHPLRRHAKYVPGRHPSPDRMPPRNRRRRFKCVCRCTASRRHQHRQSCSAVGGNRRHSRSSRTALVRRGSRQSWLPIAILSASLVGCHRASPSEVGAAERASAFPLAEMKAAGRASDVSPRSVSQAAMGTPMREAAVGGVPPVAASHSQP